MNLRLAFTSLYLPGGSKIGVGYQVHALANQLTARGHSVTVFSPDEPGEDARYEFHHVDPEPPPRTFRFALRVRGLDLGSFDLLHAHDGDYFLAAKGTPPHVRTLYGSCFSEAIHIRGARETLRMLLLGVSELASTGIADRTVAISAATARIYPWVKTIIPCGVDTQRFGWTGTSSKRSASPTILFVGTYKNRKRGRLLAEVFSTEIRPKLPNARLRMVCSDAPSAPGIDVLGRVSDADLVDLYQSSSVFCLPSSYEGFGVPYIEALAAGCPVVATPNPGANEVLDHGRFGVITPAEQLGPTLLEVLDDVERREDLAARGQSRAQCYDWSRVVDDYEAVYASLMNPR